MTRRRPTYTPSLCPWGVVGLLSLSGLLGCEASTLLLADAGVGSMAEAPDDAASPDAGPSDAQLTSADAGLVPPDAELTPPPPNPVLAVGPASSCATRGGRVWCWGALWDRRIMPAPVEVEALSGAARVELGIMATCAVWPDGHVACAGDGRSGLLGSGVTERSDTFVRVPGLDDATALALGDTFACALRPDRTVVCWGDDTFGQTGRPPPSHPVGTFAPQPTPVPVDGLTEVVALGAGRGFACALRARGDVWCWGSDAWGALGRGPRSSGASEPTPAPIEGIDDGRGLALSGNGGCVIRADRTLACWGGDVAALPGFERGREDRCWVVVEQSCWRAPRLLPLVEVSALALASDRACARTQGSWRCFGAAGEHALPDVEALDAGSDPPALGGHHVCVVDAGRVRCRGRGDQGQLGDGRAADSAAWVDVELTR